MAQKLFEKKNLFLTYPQVSDELTKDRLYARLFVVCQAANVEIQKYIVAQELHQDGGRHFHVFLGLDKPIKSRNQRLFDVVVDEDTFHPNIQGCNYPEYVQKYCRKDGDYITNIPAEDLNKKKKKDVLGDIGKRAIAGESLPTLINEYPEQLINYQRLVQSVTLFKLHSLPAIETRGCRGIWIWGASGVGKSHFARQYCREHNLTLFVKPQSKWFDGYQGEQALLIDDLDSTFLGHLLKIWADRYAQTAEVKCGTVPLMHKYIFVTSGFSIQSLFADETNRDGIVTKDNSHLRDSLLRRFSQTEMRDRNTPVLVPIVKSVQEEDSEEEEEQDDEESRAMVYGIDKQPAVQEEEEIPEEKILVQLVQ